MENPSCKLIITAWRQGILSCLTENGVPVQLDYADGSSIVGNVYAGKVRSVSRNLEAAFVDIGTELPAFLPLSRGILPRFLDGRDHSAVKQGDDILVKVKKDAHKTKGPFLMARFSEEKDEDFLKRASFVRAPGIVRAAEPFWQFLAEKTAAERKDGFEIVTDLPEAFRALTGEDPPKTERYAEKLPEAFRKPLSPLRMKGTDVPVTFPGEGSLPLTAVYSLGTAAADALSKKVWLKSGGFLVIEQTEAMTVIDVNSGKNEKKTEKDALILSTDEEAAEEALRQIRLRNLSGIILIDLIDVKTKETQEALLKKMRALASRDPVKTQVVDITKLNLAEIVRKKNGRPFADQLRRTPEESRQ